jgi:3-hydroxybutyryl-CoA dehydrogenase
MAEIRKVAVIGAGLMGSGIAEVAARAGYETLIREVSDELADQGRARIQRSLDRAVERGRLAEEDREKTLSRIHTTTALADLEDVDIVIEAVTENLEVKNQIFRELDSICRADTILASNTSSLTIAEMAAVTSRPGRMVGLHFFNPVPVMKLVEVVRTIVTDDESFDRAFAFVRALGKEPVEAKDTSGFIVNRLLVPYMLDAIRALESGLGTIEDIDKAMVLGTGYPMGPFTLSDFVGNDTLFRIAEIMFDEFRETRFAPPPLLRRMISMGYAGRKAGKGFYDYSGEEPVPVDFGL